MDYFFGLCHCINVPEVSQYSSHNVTMEYSIRSAGYGSVSGASEWNNLRNDPIQQRIIVSKMYN